MIVKIGGLDRKCAGEAAFFPFEDVDEFGEDPWFHENVVVEEEDVAGSRMPQEEIALLSDAMALRAMMPLDVTAARFDHAAEAVDDRLVA